jgi:methylated-DNA-[protein]-cysteine S-methyltransferase
MGKLVLHTNDVGLIGVWYDQQSNAPDDFGVEKPDHPILKQTVVEFDEYFAGKRKQFELPIDAQGTDFQKQVWAMLETIPFGETWSYQDLAIAIDNPKAVRAVGLANSKNPISIIVPCHRVIGKSGKLTGYAGGIDRKQKLLMLECPDELQLK